MDINKVRKELQELSEDVLARKAYRRLSFSVSQGETPEKVRKTDILLLDSDLTIDGRNMFTHLEAMIFQTLGHDFGLVVPRAHHWRGISFWVTNDGKYHGDTKFNFSHEGYTWEGTNFQQNQSGAAYYWTSSSDNARGTAYAVVFYRSGKVDIVDRAKDEKMPVRLMIDTRLLPCSID